MWHRQLTTPSAGTLDFHTSLADHYLATSPVPGWGLRQALVDQVWAAWEDGRPVLVTGLPKIGKTTLGLDVLASCEGSKVYINASDFDASAQSASLFRRQFGLPEILETYLGGLRFRRRLSQAELDVERAVWLQAAQAENAPTAFALWQNWLQKSDQSAVAVIDNVGFREFHGAISPVDYFQYISTLPFYHRIRFLMVLDGCSLPFMEKLGLMRQFDGYVRVHVPPLTQAEAYSLIRYPLTAAGISFSDEDCQTFWAFAGSHPQVLQILCQTFFTQQGFVGKKIEPLAMTRFFAEMLAPSNESSEKTLNKAMNAYVDALVFGLPSELKDWLVRHVLDDGMLTDLPPEAGWLDTLMGHGFVIQKQDGTYRLQGILLLKALRSLQRVI